MAHYKKRPKVKRYRRSFYSREMKLKKGIGIAVLVLAVLGIGWLAAPHVLDWATHTWYTVVRNRDLSASSPAVSEAASSTAASEAAASSVAEPEPAPEPEPTPGTAIVAGSWAEVDVTTLTDEAAITAAAQLGVKNLLVEVPGSSTLDEAGRTTLTRMLEDAGVEHTVIRDDAAGRFE